MCPSHSLSEQVMGPGASRPRPLHQLSLPPPSSPTSCALSPGFTYKLLRRSAQCLKVYQAPHPSPHVSLPAALPAYCYYCHPPFHRRPAGSGLRPPGARVGFCAGPASRGTEPSVTFLRCHGWVPGAPGGEDRRGYVTTDRWGGLLGVHCPLPPELAELRGLLHQQDSMESKHVSLTGGGRGAASL